MKWGICCEFDGKLMETETTTWSELASDGKAIIEQLLAPEERNESKNTGLWESNWDPSRKVNHFIWDSKIVTELIIIIIIIIIIIQIIKILIKI